MSFSRTKPSLLHHAIPGLARDLATRRIGRREFLTRACAFGVTAPVALGLSGGYRPAAAEAQPIQGGTLRIQQNIKALTDPRSYAWSEMGNLTRGFLEYLVQYNSDGSLQGMLLQTWDVNDTATVYRLALRPDVTWNNGDAFTARDVARNFERWCDTTAPGNSMASRLEALIDPGTGQIIDGAIKLLDDLTIELTLRHPDITLMVNLADYPAAIVHPSFEGGNPFEHGIGTGPFRPVELQVGERCVLERNLDHTWWGTAIFGGPYLDRVEFLDFGTDPSSWVAAADAGEVDLLYESVGDFIDVLDALGWTQTKTDTTATMIIRANALAEVEGAKPYADAAVRRALAMSVDNEICLELGYAGRGQVAENDHVSPLHPAHAELGPAIYDPAKAREDMAAAGQTEFEHELVTLDDEWQRNTGDAVAAQLRDNGFKVRRSIQPGDTYWSNWQTYPFSATQWNHRPLGVQALSLAYRSNAAWNETGFASDAFDSLLEEATSVVDVEERRKTMGKLQTILRNEGVMIQPYWRSLYNHHNGRVVGAEKHPSNEIHLHKIGFSG